MSKEPVASVLRRGVVAGVAGTAVMTAFQTVEMRVTGRDESYAPAQLAERLLPWRPRNRRRLNFITHFALGAGWGAARGLVGRAGLRGTAAVGATFAAVYPADVILPTLLGVYEPSEWTAKGAAIDIVDKSVTATATSVIYEALEGRARAPR